MKVFNWIFCLLFILFAALQYNDPDPYLWVPLYLFSSFVCGSAAAQTFYPRACILGIGVYGAYALFLFFDRSGVLSWLFQHRAENLVQSMKATKPWIEEAREFFGLLIMIGACLLNYIYAKRRVVPAGDQGAVSSR